MSHKETPTAETRGLGMRFGGLTAVDTVDLLVERGKITSLIGPNGAGKTTIFNCLSGIQSPTAGRIELLGADRRRRWTRRTTAACALISLISGLASGCLALNINGLWRAAIRRPSSFSGRPFSYRAAAGGIGAYVRGELAIEQPTPGRFNVVSADGSAILARADDRRRAEQLLAAYEQVRSKAPAEQSIVQIGRGWRLQASDAMSNVDRWPTFSTRAAAQQRKEQLNAISRAYVRQLRSAAAALVVGMLAGSAGMISVWKRSRWTAEVAAAAGVARTFQNLRLFNRLTAAENVLVALEAAGSSPAGGGRVMKSSEVAGLLEFVGLSPLANRPASQLAYGDRRRLEIARALARRPRLLLLDEPAAGMNAAERARLKELICRIRDSGVTIMLIEHEMTLVMDISDHVVALANGSKIAEGTPAAVRANPIVIEAYLGTG